MGGREAAMVGETRSGEKRPSSAEGEGSEGVVAVVEVVVAVGVGLSTEGSGVWASAGAVVVIEGVLAGAWMGSGCCSSSSTGAVVVIVGVGLISLEVWIAEMWFVEMPF